VRERDPFPADGANLKTRPLTLRPTPWLRDASGPIDLSESAIFFDQDYQAIRGRDAVLEAIRREVRRPAEPVFAGLQLRTSTISRFFNSAPSPEERLLFLNIPIDSRAASRAREWAASSNPHDRWNAAVVLGHFKSKQNVEILQRLARDPFATDRFQWPPTHVDANMRGRPFAHVRAAWMDDLKFRRLRVIRGPGKWSAWDYPVRRAAWHSLNDLGESPAAAVSAPVYPVTYLGGWAFGAAGLVLVAVVGVPIWRSRRRRSSTPMVFAGVSGVCLVLLVAVGGLWVRSYWVIDELSFHRTGSWRRCELATLPGKLRLIRLDDWHDPSPVTFMSAPRSDVAEREWNLKPTPLSWFPAAPVAQPAAVSVRFAGVTYDRDEFVIRFSKPTTAHILTAPIWPICVLLAVAPAVRVVRVVRSWRRFARGHCRACGYDMRATPQRCPECGAMSEGEAVTG